MGVRVNHIHHCNTLTVISLGRRPTVLLSHGAYFLGGVLTLIFPDFIFLLFCRWTRSLNIPQIPSQLFKVSGRLCSPHGLPPTLHHRCICDQDETVLYFCAVVEYCGISSRTVPLMMMIVSYTLASLVLPLVTAFLPSWNFLALIAASSVLPVLLCWRSVHTNALCRSSIQTLS